MKQYLRIALVFLAFALHVQPASGQDQPAGAFVPPDCLVPDIASDTVIQLTVLVDPRGGDACKNGYLAGLYQLAVDASNTVHFSCYDNILFPYWLFNDVAGSYHSSPEAQAYRQTLGRSFASENSTYCGKLGSTSKRAWEAGEGLPLPASQMIRLHGTLHSRDPRVTFEIHAGRVRVVPRQACCTNEKQCAAVVLIGSEQCPVGTFPAGPNTDCSHCQNSVRHVEPPNREVSCCVQQGCKPLPEQECGLMNGRPLPPGTACSVLHNPCDQVTGSCSATNGECADSLTEAECYQFDSNGSFRLGQACAPVQGGCCDPMGICRPTTAEECPPNRGVYHPEGCPAQCAAQIGACTLECPNRLNLNCMEATFDECQRSGGIGFTTSKGCPEDPVLRKCEEPLCYECRDLAIPDYWPTLDGQLYLYYEDGQCPVRFIDKGGVQHDGRWECRTEEMRRRVKITWSNNKELWLVEAIDGDIVRLIPEFTNNQRPKGVFPCSDADVDRPSDGYIQNGYVKAYIVRKGEYLCAKYQKQFYGVKSNGFITIYHHNLRFHTYDYGYRIRVDSTRTERNGNTVISGYSVDDNTGKEKTPVTIVYE
ncbi:MAG: hypothetical protein KDD70_04525 [Bdellovibrionales bacterium]|nr:hypothetical protein [Bdellovibrionales bacterium]